MKRYPKSPHIGVQPLLAARTGAALAAQDAQEQGGAGTLRVRDQQDPENGLRATCVEPRGEHLRALRIQNIFEKLSCLNEFE